MALARREHVIEKRCLGRRIAIGGAAHRNVPQVHRGGQVVCAPKRDAAEPYIRIPELCVESWRRRAAADVTRIEHLNAGRIVGQRIGRTGRRSYENLNRARECKCRNPCPPCSRDCRPIHSACGSIGIHGGPCRLSNSPWRHWKTWLRREQVRYRRCRGHSSRNGHRPKTRTSCSLRSARQPWLPLRFLPAHG